MGKKLIVIDEGKRAPGKFKPYPVRHVILKAVDPEDTFKYCANIDFSRPSEDNMLDPLFKNGNVLKCELQANKRNVNTFMPVILIRKAIKEKV